MARELPREGEVVQPGDAEHGGVNAVAFQAAVTKDLPCLHPLDDVLDTGPDLAVGGIVLLFPSWQFRLATFTAVRNEQAGAPIAAVRDDRGPADGGLRTGKFPPGRESASMTTWWLVEYRQFFDCSATGWSRVGTSVPSTISTAPLRNR